jgi:hypothetical protein
VVLGFCYLFVSSEGLSARKKPSNLEYALANFAMRLSIPAQARRANNPLRPDPEILLQAAAHFKEHCAVCRGEDGTGKTELAAGLSPEVPDLHAEHIHCAPLEGLAGGLSLPYRPTIRERKWLAAVLAQFWSSPRRRSCSAAAEPLVSTRPNA